MLQAVLQPGMGDHRAKRGNKVDTSTRNSRRRSWMVMWKSVWCCEMHQPNSEKTLLVNSQQFENNHNKLRAIIQAYLNSNKNWIANDFINDTKGPDPTEVDHIGKGKCKGKGNGKSKGNGKCKGKGKSKDNGKGRGKSNGKGAKSDQQDKECYVCGKRNFARGCWSRAHQERTVNEMESSNVYSDVAKEFVFTIENTVKDISWSQSGC